MDALVVGAGTMGAGIAQVLAQAGRTVTVVDPGAGARPRAEAAMRDSLARLARRGRLADPPDVVLARVRWADDLASLPAGGVAEVAIEAVPEDAELKGRVLAAMERASAAAALLATNTSGIPLAELASGLREPGRLVGLHFFNPVPAMAVVEVVAADGTSDDARRRAVELVEALGKDPVEVRGDVAGFALNRVAMAASNEAIRLVEQGVIGAADLDRGMRGAFGWRMGPLETADLVGLDVTLAARSHLFARTGDPRFEPPRLLRELVEQGRLGRKSGRGFHRYDPD